MSALLTADYEQALEYVHDLHEQKSELNQALLAGLRALVPCDLVSMNYFDARLRLVAAVDQPAGTCAAVDGLGTVARLGQQHPVIRYYARTRDRSARRLSDFTSDRRFERTELYDELYRRLRLRYELSVFFPVNDGIGAVALDRGSRDFSDRDRELLSLLVPHLSQVWCVEAILRPDARPGGLCTLLTPREHNVAVRATSGATNREIAQALGISARTVQKHLEHVYEKIGARNRTATAQALASRQLAPRYD